MLNQTSENHIYYRLKNFATTKTFKYALALLIIPLMLAYMAWEIYWYSKVSLMCIKWHTHLAFLAFLLFNGNLIIWIITKRLAPNATTGLITSFTSVIFTLSVIEVVLMITGTNKTYFEKQMGYYYSHYHTQHEKRYHIWTINPHCIEKKEFVYCRPTNKEGVGDSNWVTTGTPGVKRIMAIGDSFTEGDGAPYDSTYPAFLKQNLQRLGDSIYMMNAGVCGSDPFYNYIHFKERLLAYKPDIVIQMFSSADIETDFIARGGLERFKRDQVKYRNPPKTELLYAISYTSRFFYNAAGYDEFFLTPALVKQMLPEMDSSFIALFKEYKKLCSENGIKLVIVLRPDLREIDNNHYTYNHTNILTALKADKDITVIDLLERYQNHIHANGTKANEYYWKMDGHHNAKGYQMLAGVITPDIHTLANDSVR